MIKGYSFKVENIIQLLKKHYCPFCATELSKRKVSEIVNSESPEAKIMISGSLILF